MSAISESESPSPRAAGQGQDDYTCKSDIA